MTPPIDFPGFSKLPEELREMIYLKHFTDTLAQHIQDRPIEPSITRVSQSTRKKTLPLFYELYPLRLQTLIFGGSHGLDYRRPQWYRKLGQKLAHIRMIELEFDFGERYGFEGDEPFTLTYTVQLDKQHNRYTVECASAVSGDQSRGPQISGDEQEVLLLAIKSVLDGFVAEHKIGRLGPRDLDDLVDACFAVEECD
jgi:hypothetical protein